MEAIEQGYILEDTGEAERLESQCKQEAYSLKEEFGDLNLSNVKALLDAGCGTGTVSRFLHQQNPTMEIYACDQSEIRLAQAKDLNPKNFNFFQSDIPNIDLKENSIDLVVNRYVFEYLPNPIEVCLEFKRILKPEGVVRIVDLDGVFFNIFSTNEKLQYYLQKIKNHAPIDLYVGRKIPSYLKQAGFRNIQWDATHHNFKGKELELERENNAQRIDFARTTGEKILGSKREYDKFKQLYLNEMMKKESVLFHSKFIVTAKK